MKSKLFAFAALSIILPLSASIQAQTAPRRIESIEVQGADGSVIVRAVGNWERTCDGTVVTGVYFSKESVPGGYSAVYASLIAAYAAGKTVRFYGACLPNRPGFYGGTYLIVSDQ